MREKIKDLLENEELNEEKLDEVSGGGAGSKDWSNPFIDFEPKENGLVQVP